MGVGATARDMDMPGSRAAGEVTPASTLGAERQGQGPHATHVPVTSDLGPTATWGLT